MAQDKMYNRLIKEKVREARKKDHQKRISKGFIQGDQNFKEFEKEEEKNT